MKVERGRQRKRGLRETRRRLVLLAGILTACCVPSHAQTFYKWTDDRGIIHFADEPPPDAHGVEQRQLPAPVAVQPAAPDSVATEGNAKKAEGFSGPARVIVVSRQAIRNGPRAVHVIGEVKNVGGEEATAVNVALSVVDATQGTPCVNEAAAVSPSTLSPGDIGNFDVALDSPCLAGDTPVDAVPVWK